ncbi:MAG: hypothetical protein HY202_03280 [Nitrospirae bacterium]|nr:hypothetical protein [Nitrospirota bacterium]
MEISEANHKLKPYTGRLITLKDQTFTLESVEEDHLVLRNEDQMHTFIWYTSIESILENLGGYPEIVLSPRQTGDQD